MATQSTLSMKLLIDTGSKRVLFAEAGKDCVDFLFHILCLPVARLISLLREQGMEGSLSNLYKSIENLNESYIQPNQTKHNLLKPVAPIPAGSSVPLLPLNAASTEKKFYRCGCSYGSVTDDQRAKCPNCRHCMTTNVTYVAPPPAEQEPSGGEGGFVKGVVTYMVMDDLVVQPMSTISCITLLNKFNVEKVDVLEEKVVQLGMNEALKLLRASFQSKNVLTDVFLSNTDVFPSDVDVFPSDT